MSDKLLRQLIHLVSFAVQDAEVICKYDGQRYRIRSVTEHGGIEITGDGPHNGWIFKPDELERVR